MNMTVLHEIGHCVLDHTGHSLEEESEATFFAKYAMSPPPLVNQIHPKSPIDIERSFRLSYEASLISFSYYQKWILYSGEKYKDYEVRLLSLFNDRFLLRGGA
jgi:Zn-dependent peptidase ImmA (M78 family)